jgi:hypothetical protein
MERAVGDGAVREGVGVWKDRHRFSHCGRASY